MILGPVFNVELLTLGRRRRYFVTRVLYGLILLFFMTMCYSSFGSWSTSPLQRQAMFATSFFYAFSFVQLLAVFTLAPAMIAGTIAGEHERRTIDYLLTTSLNDTEISLGKFSARLLAIGMQLAAGLPILAIAMTLGGISAEKLLLSFVISLLTLGSVGSFCLSVSTRSQASREAITRSFMILIAVMIVPAVLGAIFESSVHFSHPGSTWHGISTACVPMTRFLVSVNPLVFLGMALSDAPIMIEFGYFAAVHLGLALLFTAWSVVGLRRFYVRQAGKSAVKKKEKRRWGVPRLGDYPMWWKERMTSRQGRRAAWSGKIATLLLYGLGLWGVGYAFLDSLELDDTYSRRTSIEEFATGVVPTIACLALILITARSAGSVTAERERDTWITLLSTPVEAREVVSAKVFASIYEMRYWYFLIVLSWALCVFIRPAFAWAVPVLVLVHAVALFFCSSLGVLCSLASKTSLRAMGTALTVVVLGAGFGPLFAAMIFQTEELITFSPPVVMGIATAHMVERINDRSWRGGEGSFFFFSAISLAMYAVAAVILYAQAVGNFDWLTERISGSRRLAGRADDGDQRAEPVTDAT